MPEGDLHGLRDRFATCGASPGGGVTRLCGSVPDGEAHDCPASVMRDAGASLAVDVAGDQFGMFRLTDQTDAPFVMAGSHLDSQTRAGRVDGTLGVAAAVRVGHALVEAKRVGTRFDVDVCIVNSTDEEGARVRPSLLDSGASVPARVELTLEIRSIDDGLLAEAGANALALLREADERANVAVAIKGWIDRPIRPPPAAVSDQLVARCAAQAGHRSIAVDTIAGHDALSLLGLCSIDLLFVPSLEGVSHNEREAAAAPDLDAGPAVLLRAAQALCEAGGGPVHALVGMLQ